VGDAVRQLAGLVEDELFQPAPEAALPLARAIRERLGPATAAVLFYGSCLRRDTTEGVFDFYAVVDSYRAAYGAGPVAALNAVLPPNVFYVEVPCQDAILRAKYAVLSARDFERGAGPSSLRTGIWARFCQPTRAVWARDDGARELLVRTAVNAVRTALRRIAPLLPEPGRVDPAELWQRVFAETYRNEMRPEIPGTIRTLYEADPARYDRAARLGLAELEASGELDLAPRARRRARLVWGLRRPLAKVLYAAQLLKTALTFGDWLPYALWKLERHTGHRIVPTERQRRHPLIWGWPILWRVLWARTLR
jgi:hypothetical protein